MILKCVTWGFDKACNLKNMELSYGVKVQHLPQIFVEWKNKVAENGNIQVQVLKSTEVN